MDREELWKLMVRMTVVSPLQGSLVGLRTQGLGPGRFCKPCPRLRIISRLQGWLGRDRFLNRRSDYSGLYVCTKVWVVWGLMVLIEFDS